MVLLIRHSLFSLKPIYNAIIFLATTSSFTDICLVLVLKHIQQQTRIKEVSLIKPTSDEMNQLDGIALAFRAAGKGQQLADHVGAAFAAGVKQIQEFHVVGIL